MSERECETRAVFLIQLNFFLAAINIVQGLCWEDVENN